MVIWSENPGGLPGTRVNLPAPIPVIAPVRPVPVARGEPVPRIPEGVEHWYGRATGHWFAVVPWPWAELRALLVEADTEDALADQVWRLLSGVGSGDPAVPSR